MQDLITLDPGTHRETWLDARVPVITATQAAAIVGSHPYATMRDVWDEKMDPDYERDADRNPWLMERAELGVSREAAIIEWASGETGLRFHANTALVTRAGIEQYAATPDGWAKVGMRSTGSLNGFVQLLASEGLAFADVKGREVVLEAKTTSQDWATKGLPQHIVDQVLWQLYVTGYPLGIVAQERYAWKGRGDQRTATEVGRHLFIVVASEHRARLDFILESVRKFQHWLAEGIAPETELDVTEPPLPEWDDDEQTAADKAVVVADLEAAAEHLDSIANLEAQATELADKMKAHKEAVRALLKPYEGRRVTIRGERFAATLLRYNKAKVDTTLLKPADLRRITTWGEIERLTFDPITTTENTEETP